MSCVTSGSSPRFVVDGQAPLRQCLHPEACNKDIELPEHYNHFHDLRKEFVACYSTHGELSTFGIQEMLECILLQVALTIQICPDTLSTPLSSSDYFQPCCPQVTVKHKTKIPREFYCRVNYIFMFNRIFR